MKAFVVSGPDWLDSDNSSCETCGHWSSFSAGFEYDGSGYVRGWYEDEISCFGGARYYSFLYDETSEENDPDTVDNFRRFLKHEGTEEAQQILDELNRLGL